MIKILPSHNISHQFIFQSLFLVKIRSFYKFPRQLIIHSFILKFLFQCRVNIKDDMFSRYVTDGLYFRHHPRYSYIHIHIPVSTTTNLNAHFVLLLIHVSRLARKFFTRKKERNRGGGRTRKPTWNFL